MNFRLFYRGPLRANGDPTHKHRIRERFHGQLKELWKHPPLDGPTDGGLFIVEGPIPHPGDENSQRHVNGFTFQLLATAAMHMYVELELTLMCPEEPGRLFQGGDIDNRLKTLFDALRYPKTPNELPRSAAPDPTQTPFYCLLEDDRLIRGLSITYDRLLDSEDPREVVLLLNVKVRADTISPGILGIVG